MRKYSSSNAFSEWGRQQAIDYVLQKGLTVDDLSRLDCSSVSKAGLEDKLYEAGHTLKGRHWHDFSGRQLTLVLYALEWDSENARSFYRAVSSALKSEFGKEAEAKGREYNFMVRKVGRRVSAISSVQLLREKTGNYSGNLYEARRRWKFFVPSEEDFRKSVRLPEGVLCDDKLSLDDESDFLLGVIYGAGYIAGKTKTTGGASRLFIKGDKKDLNFYEGIAVPKVETVFNLSGVYTVQEHEKRDNGGKYRFPLIDISSLAIASWLERDLAFPAPKSNKRDVLFPEFVYDSLSFLEGIVATVGHIKGERLTFVDRDISFIREIQKLLQSRSLKSKLKNILRDNGNKEVTDEDVLIEPARSNAGKSYYLTLSRRYTRMLNEAITFLNPKLNGSSR